jgi:hypothetical protein
MKKRCSTCIYWGPPGKRYYDPIPIGWQTCQRERQRRPRGYEGLAGFYPDAQSVMLYDDTMYPHCELLTGPEFGCIHYEEE